MTETAKASIVVGVDGSEHATHALRWAAREAELHGAELTAVLAWDLFNQLHPGGDRTFDPAYDEAAADRALLAVIETGLGAEGAPSVRRRPVCDLPAAGLLSAAEGADLLVLGARGLGGFRGLLLGSVSQQCLNHATGPVAIVRATAPGSADDDAARDEATPGTTADDTALGPEPETTDERPGERVVVGVDASAPAQAALRWAIAEGALRQATVQVVHAWEPPMTVDLLVGGLPYDLGHEQAAARRLVDSMVDQALAAAGSPDVAIERVVTAGAPVGSLLDAAATADVVVVGRRGAGGFTRLLLGSVSEKLARHAPCPVVVCPADASD
jgi:nucleotide-binding universal stress UspA family protein